MSKTQARWISFSGRTLAAVVLIATGGFVLHAQSTQASGTPPPTVSAQEPTLNLQADDSGQQAYSSSDAEQVGTEIAANSTNPFESLNAMQYGGGRQRYGRPRYRGGNTNADGSPKWDFYVGGGFGMPVSDQTNFLTTSWGLQFGGGRMFNRMVGVNLEFAYDKFGLTGTTIDNYAALYGDPTNTNGFGGNNHVWSLGVQPVFNVHSGEGIGAYITGGVGFYHKVTNFTLPQQETECDPVFGFCEGFIVNANIDHYTSNAAGFDGGFGVTYKFSRFASERLYAEVRYVYVANQYKPGLTAANETTYTGNNLFPENSQRTSYIPVKFGLRF